LHFAPTSHPEILKKNAPQAPRKGGKVRLDELLLNRDLAPSKARSQAMIRAGKVRTGTEILDKPGKLVRPDLEIEIQQPSPFVGRGAEKLAGFLKEFPLPLDGLHILDVGASTGGFTDYLLQNGAETATCVDVGHGQLHYKLRSDPRVTNLERINARHLLPADLPRPHFDLVVMDLSFISLKKVWPAIWPLVAPGRHMIALVKPQFEAERAEVDAGRGVIRSIEIRERVLKEIRDWVRLNLAGAEEIGHCESPIHGADGNLEYLVGWKNIAPTNPSQHIKSSQ
jgi:23S rRNA (cytidine1920-2'-O)/16S rRNA (cytidine1409-2'-O)-methyltransferase